MNNNQTTRAIAGKLAAQLETFAKSAVGDSTNPEVVALLQHLANQFPITFLNIAGRTPELRTFSKNIAASFREFEHSTDGDTTHTQAIALLTHLSTVGPSAIYDPTESNNLVGGMIPSLSTDAVFQQYPNPSGVITNTLGSDAVLQNWSNILQSTAERINHQPINPDISAFLSYLANYRSPALPSAAPAAAQVNYLSRSPGTFQQNIKDSETLGGDPSATELKEDDKREVQFKTEALDPESQYDIDLALLLDDSRSHEHGP